MKRKRAAGGILLLILAGLLVVEAFGPYNSVWFTPTWFSLSFSIFVAAVVSAIGGVFLLQAARTSATEDLSEMAASVADPHHPAPIRAPMMSTPSGGRAYAVTGGGAGVYNPEREPDETVGEEPD